jgi:hypothetical protein
MARTADLMPPALLEALAEIFGDDPSGVEIVERSWYARLHHRATATTRRNRIYLRGSAQDFFADPELLLHEYFHVLRQWNRGRLNSRAYLLEWLRRGYWRNRYEHQARRFVALRLADFRKLLT